MANYEVIMSRRGLIKRDFFRRASISGGFYYSLIVTSGRLSGRYRNARFDIGLAEFAGNDRVGDCLG